MIKNVSLTPNDICTSLDIISLYPNVSVEEALYQIAMNEDLPANVIDLADYCLKNTYFTFSMYKLYRQTKDATMVSARSPVETKTLNIAHSDKSLVKIRR